MIELTCADFYEVNDKEEVQEILNPIIFEFVKKEYRNVPNHIELAEEMRVLIRKNGLGLKPLVEVAEKAASSMGMK